MNAAELRKKLDEGLKPDTSGKTTPIQRLTPFLLALMDYLEDSQRNPFDMLHKVSSDDATGVATPSTDNSKSDGAPNPTI